MQEKSKKAAKQKEKTESSEKFANWQNEKLKREVEQKQRQLMISEAQNAMSSLPNGAAEQHRMLLLEEAVTEEKSIINAELNALSQQRLVSQSVQATLCQQTKHLITQEEKAVGQAYALTEQEQELSKKIRDSKTVLRTVAASDGSDNWPSALFSSMKFILGTNDKEPEKVR